jgi:hypothetical protein
MVQYWFLLKTCAFTLMYLGPIHGGVNNRVIWRDRETVHKRALILYAFRKVSQFSDPGAPASRAFRQTFIPASRDESRASEMIFLSIVRGQEYYAA